MNDENVESESVGEAVEDVTPKKKRKTVKLWLATCRHCGTQHKVPASVYQANEPYCCGQCGTYAPAQYVLDFNKEVAE